MSKNVRYQIDAAGKNKEQDAAGADYIYKNGISFKPTKKSAFRYASKAANSSQCPMFVFCIAYPPPTHHKKITRVWKIEPAATAAGE